MGRLGEGFRDINATQGYVTQETKWPLICVSAGQGPLSCSGGRIWTCDLWVMRSTYRRSSGCRQAGSFG